MSRRLGPIQTDALVDIDPRIAIGGLWDEVGKQQFDFLVRQGLTRTSSILDIGCGTLRAGRFFIEFLEPKLYFGFDLSEKAIRFGKSLVEDLELSGKMPSLSKVDEHGLRFVAYQGMTFDFLLAQSVFSHLKEEQISVCLQNVGSVMNAGSRFFFTYHPGPKIRRRGQIDFEYPHSFFEALAKENRLALVDVSNEYSHPRGQRMIVATKAHSA